jgi:hypothetical protein
LQGWCVDLWEKSAARCGWKARSVFLLVQSGFYANATFFCYALTLLRGQMLPVEFLISSFFLWSGKSSLNLWIFWRYLTKDVYLFSASLTYCKNIWVFKIIHILFYTTLYLICTLPTNDLKSVNPVAILLTDLSWSRINFHLTDIFFIQLWYIFFIKRNPLLNLADSLADIFYVVSFP